jgi:predicted metallo-beta-lactamase superfamily hydrolase
VIRRNLVVFFSLLSDNARITEYLIAGVATEFLDIKPSLLEARRKELLGKIEIGDGN